MSGEESGSEPLLLAKRELDAASRAVRGLAVGVTFVVFAWLGPQSHEAEVVATTVHATQRDVASIVSSVVAAGRLRDRAPAPAAGHLSVVPLGGSEFRVAVRAADSDAALAACKEAAEHIAAPHAVPSGSSTLALSAPERAAAQLVASHPEWMAESAPEPQRPARPESERIRLQIERAHVQADLAQRTAASESQTENPFDPGVPRSDPRLLRRRLAEIDGLLAAPLPRPEPASIPSALELKLLLDATLLEANDEALRSHAAEVVQVASVVSGATLPSRSLLALIGVVAAFSAVFLPVRSRRRRTDGALVAPAATSEAASAPSVVASVSESPPPALEAEPSVEPAPERPPLQPLSNEVVPALTSSVMALPVQWQVDPRSSPARYAELCSELGRRGLEDCFVVVVVGTRAASDARSVLAVALASGLAANDQTRVLLFEADLGQTSLARIIRLEVPANVNLASQLTARIDGVAEEPWYVAKCSASLHVLPCHRSAPDLLLSTVLESCIVGFRMYYNVIIINGPSVDERSACRALDDLADGVVLAHADHEANVENWPGLFTNKRLSVVVAVA